MNIPESQAPELAEGEYGLFGMSPPVLFERDDELQFAAINEPVPYLIRRALDYGRDVPEMARAYMVPAYADLYNRGLIGISDEEVGGTAEKDNHIYMDNIRDLRRATEDFRMGDTAVIGLAELVFSGVLLRPKGLVVPKADRLLHSSDFDSGDMSFYVDQYRNRINLLRRMDHRKTVKPYQHKKINALSDANGRIDVAGFIDSGASARKPEVLKYLGSLQMGRYALQLLPLLEAGPDEAEELREKFITLGLATIEDNGGRKILGEALFNMDISPDTEKHILSGDAKGGGHHIPSLDPAYSRIIGPVVRVPSSVRGTDQLVEVARKQRFNSRGELLSDRVETFFPSDWTAERVLASIKTPLRLVYERERDGSIEQYFEEDGLLIKRVLGVYTDETAEVVTAFPKAHVPGELIAQLMPKKAPEIAS